MSGALHTKVLRRKHSAVSLRAIATPSPTYAGTNGQIGCCQFKCSGGLFSEHWIDGQRCGPLPRRHSGKGRAVPKRCPSISALLPFGARNRAPRAANCVACSASTDSDTFYRRRERAPALLHNNDIDLPCTDLVMPVASMANPSALVRRRGKT